MEQYRHIIDIDQANRMAENGWTMLTAVHGSMTSFVMKRDVWRVGDRVTVDRDDVKGDPDKHTVTVQLSEDEYLRWKDGMTLGWRVAFEIRSVGE